MSFELADVYTAEYDEAVKEYFPPFPRGLAGKYYEEGLQYFSTFDGFGNCEILSVEDKFELNIRGNRFVGIADLVLRDKTSGAISVIDHKSKSIPSLKKKLFENTRQLYTYAFYVKERFGVYPDLRDSICSATILSSTRLSPWSAMRKHWTGSSGQFRQSGRSGSGAFHLQDTSAGSSALSGIIVPLPTKSFILRKGVIPNDHLRIVGSHTAGRSAGF